MASRACRAACTADLGSSTPPLLRTTSLVHLLASSFLRPGDVAVDATCGRGRDALVLARLVLHPDRMGRLHGLDLHPSALESTQQLLQAHLDDVQLEHVHLHRANHADMAHHVDADVALVLFNLGYLPGAKEDGLYTRASTTRMALDASQEILKDNGAVVITTYVGHPGGVEEDEAVSTWMHSRPSQSWTTGCWRFANRKDAPRTYVAVKHVR